MSTKDQLIIGYAPTRRTVFSREDALKYKKLTLDKIKALGYKTVDIEDINEDGLLIEEKDIDSAVKKLTHGGADSIISSHCNFGSEDIVARVTYKMGLPFLLWGLSLLYETDIMSGSVFGEKVIVKTFKTYSALQ